MFSAFTRTSITGRHAFDFNDTDDRLTLKELVMNSGMKLASGLWLLINGIAAVSASTTLPTVATTQIITLHQGDPGFKGAALWVQSQASNDTGMRPVASGDQPELIQIQQIVKAANINRAAPLLTVNDAPGPPSTPGTPGQIYTITSQSRRAFERWTYEWADAGGNAWGWVEIGHTVYTCLDGGLNKTTGDAQVHDATLCSPP